MENIRIEIHNRDLKTRKKSIENWKCAEENKKDFLKFLSDAEIGKLNKGKKIGNSRLVKYCDLMKLIFEFFDKPISELNNKDIEKFERYLIKSKYSHWTQVMIKRALQIYVRWKLGETKQKDLCGWLDTRKPIKTPDYLSESDIEKLYKNCKNNKERFLICVLFDSGARAEELHNIRFEDIQLPNKNNANDTYVKLTIKEEYSKTKGRAISLYWKYSLEAVRDYLNDRINEGIKSNEPIFSQSYDLTRQFLNRLGKKVLKKSINYHLFRHSSATYYATKMNRQQLCYRFGWSFSSNMTDVYISRSGMENKELDEKFTSTELEDIKIQFEKEKLNKELELQKLKLEYEERLNNFKEEVLQQLKIKLKK